MQYQTLGHSLFNILDSARFLDLKKRLVYFVVFQVYLIAVKHLKDRSYSVESENLEAASDTSKQTLEEILPNKRLGIASPSFQIFLRSVCPFYSLLPYIKQMSLININSFHPSAVERKVTRFAMVTLNPDLLKILQDTKELWRYIVKLNAKD